MILLLFGSIRATAVVFLSISLSALAAFLAISIGGGTVKHHGARAGTSLLSFDR